MCQGSGGKEEGKSLIPAPVLSLLDNFCQSEVTIALWIRSGHPVVHNYVGPQYTWLRSISVTWNRFLRGKSIFPCLAYVMQSLMDLAIPLVVNCIERDAKNALEVFGTAVRSLSSVRQLVSSQGRIQSPRKSSHLGV